MNTTVKNITLENKIFSANEDNFTSLALDVFNFQYQYNVVYRQYCDSLKINQNNITNIELIPYLPIQFFKTHNIVTTNFKPTAIFESSGTTQTINSKHYVKDTNLYVKNFNETFQLFYGNPTEWCIIALLPSYVERNNSSLVMMVDDLIKKTNNNLSGFYLNDGEKLKNILDQLEKQQQKTLLIGVTFALLDFAEQCPMDLKHTIIMETGGMKGRRKEMIREQVHRILCYQFNQSKIHSEYGMTELLSQAYSNGDGIFKCPPWMKVLLRDEDDPLTIKTAKTNSVISGAINIIDLANLYSCSFIATEDAGRLYTNNSFEILGRIDNTDIRGCSLLAL